MPEPGREPGATTTLRLQGSEGKKKKKNPRTKPQEPAPGGSRAKSPWKLQKSPPNPAHMGCLFWQGWGKKEEKIKCIEKSHLQVYLPQETWHLGKSRVQEGRARCKGPGDTQSTCETPLPCPDTRFNLVFPGILALGEGANTAAPAAKPTLTAYTQNQGGSSLQSCSFSTGFEASAPESPWRDTSPGGAQSNGQRFWGWISVPTTHFLHHPGSNLEKETKIEGSVLQPGQSRAEEMGESPKTLPKRTPMKQLPKINILSPFFFFLSPPPSKLGHVKLGQHS